MSDTLTLIFPIDAALRRAAQGGFAHTQRRNPMRRVGFLIGGGVIGFVLLNQNFLPFIEPIHLILLAVGVLLQTALVRFEYRRQMRVIEDLEANSLVGSGEMRIVVAPDHLEVTGTGIASRIAWGAVDAILDMGRYIGLRMGARTVAIPLTALPEGTTKEQFIQMLENRRTFG